MKNLICLLIILTTASLLQSQSFIVYDAATQIEVTEGADICADSVVINGTFSGIGTICGQGPSAVESEEKILPDRFELFQNYPNPFNPVTTIRFAIPEIINMNKLVTLKVYDILGNVVATLMNEEKPAGFYELDFDASGLTSGIYFYKLKAGYFSSVRKMILLK